MTDEQGFEEVAGRLRPYLCNLLYAMCGDRFDAEDLVQETLLRAYQNWTGFRHDSSVRTWLTRIAMNTFYAARRKDRPHQSLSLGTLLVRDSPDEPERIVILREFQWCVYHTLYHHVPESYRAALVLRDMHGVSYREIAEMLGCSEQAARLRVHRGRRHFRDHFKEGRCFAFTPDYACICDEIRQLALQSHAEMERTRRILRAAHREERPGHLPAAPSDAARNPQRSRGASEPAR